MDEIIVLNLPNAIERKWAIIGAFSVEYCDPQRLRFWKAIPGNDFQNVEELVDFAVADGFPFFQDWLKEQRIPKQNWSNEQETQKSNPKYVKILAQTFSYCQMLRHVIENRIVALIMYDDRYVRYYEDFLQLLKFLHDEEGEFLFLQTSYYLLPNSNLLMPHIQHKKIHGLIEGPLGGDENAMVFTPKGAEFFLHYLINNYRGSVEGTLSELTYVPRDLRKGIWTARGRLTNPLRFNMGSTIFGNLSDKTLDGTKIEE